MRTIFFDVDGVLVHGYHAKPELRKCWDENIEKDLGVNRNHFAENFIFGPFVKEVIVGKVPLRYALNEYLLSINSKVNVDDFIEYWLSHDANINEPLIQKVKLLKRTSQVRLLIATNQEHTRANYLMNERCLKLYFDDIFYSARIGFSKPSRQYFEKVSELIGNQHEPPIFFDDTQSVVDAANDFGWEAYQFDNVSDLGKSPLLASLLF